MPSKKGWAHLRDQQKMNNKDNKASTKNQQNKSPNPEHFGDVWGYISTTKMSTKIRPLNLHPRKLTAGTEKKLVVDVFRNFPYGGIFRFQHGSFLWCMRIWNSHSLKTKHDSKSPLKPMEGKDKDSEPSMVYVPST